MGWAGLKNGELIRTAEENGVEVFLTGDTTLEYEQNLTGRRLAIVRCQLLNCPSLKSTCQKSWPLSTTRNPAVFRRSIAVRSTGGSKPLRAVIKRPEAVGERQLLQTVVAVRAGDRHMIVFGQVTEEIVLHNAAVEIFGNPCGRFAVA